MFSISIRLWGEHRLWIKDTNRATHSDTKWTLRFILEEVLAFTEKQESAVSKNIRCDSRGGATFKRPIRSRGIWLFKIWRSSSISIFSLSHSCVSAQPL